MNLRHRSTTTLALLAVGAIALTGCATEQTPEAPAPASAGESISVTDPWVKAADEGMSAAFGEITNDGDTEVTIVSATSDASTMLELHETVDDGSGTMTMQQIDGGFAIGAGQTLSLEPGGNHIMFMDLVDPLEAGEEITVTLTFSDDSTTEITAPVKDYSGANESYSGGDEMDMDHGSTDEPEADDESEATDEHAGHEDH